MKPLLFRNLNVRSLILALLMLAVVGSIGRNIWQRSNINDESLCSSHHDTYDIKQVTIDNKRFKVLVADSPAKWEYGLMNVKSKKDICGHDGMIFTFPIAMPQTFWNKNTLVDLDIYWLNGEKIEGRALLPAVTKEGLQTISSPVPVKGVMEIVLE